MASHPHVLARPRPDFVPEAATARRKVLVVEGCHTTRRTIATMLERLGLQAIEATTAEEGWILGTTWPLDLAVISHALAMTTGADLVRRMRTGPEARLHGLPIIGLSQHEPCEDALLAAGADCVVRRPCCESDLMRPIRWVIEVYWSKRGSGGG